MQSAAVIVMLMLCSILIINLIRTVFKYFDYKITKKMGHYFLWFVKYKSTILKPEKVQIVTVRNYFQRKMNILEIKIKQATGGEKRNVGRLLKFWMQ
jgi:putative membrane protein